MVNINLLGVIKLDKKFNFIISLLGMIAFAFVLLLLNKYCWLNKLISNNEIYISTYTGNRLKNNTSSNYLIATYLNESDQPELKGLSDANMVFEYLGNNGRTIYKAIFHDKYPDKIYPIVDIKNSSRFFISEINFTDFIPSTIEPSQNINSIFITFNENTSSNFIYNNGMYYHFKDKIKDIDLNNNSQIAVSNIVVLLADKDFYNEDFVYSKPCFGEGILFSDGKKSKLTWNLTSNGIFEVFNNNKPISLVRGNTWWIIINKNCSIAYE